MKVNIDQTIEVSDETRKRIADLLGQKTATRDDLKAFIWEHGRNWEIALGDPSNGNPYPVADEPEPAEDLLGEDLEVNLDDLLGDDEDLI